MQSLFAVGWKRSGLGSRTDDHCLDHSTGSIWDPRWSAIETVRSLVVIVVHQSCGDYMPTYLDLVVPSQHPAPSTQANARPKGNRRIMTHN
jgi:hypothetical protein